MLPLPIEILGALVVGGVGFVLGRRVAGSARRLRELRGALEAATAEREKVQEELQDYRTQVSDHFATTSERLHDLTVQYRAVYDHLAEGAGQLCPESFEQLDGGLGLDTLPDRVPEGQGEASAASPHAVPRSDASKVASGEDPS